MRILSISAAHDSSVCVLNDGKLEFFSKEERLSRIKRDKQPILSLEKYLSLNMGKIDEFLWCAPANYSNPKDEVAIRNGFADQWYSLYLKKRLQKDLKFHAIGHHISHATLAFVNSGFDEAIVVVIDRDGSIVFIENDPVARESESVYLFSKELGEKAVHKGYWVYKPTENKSRIKKFIESNLPECNINVNSAYSIVKVYEAATTLIDQNPLENGKTMGLASYGENIQYSPLFLDGNPISNYFETLESEQVCFYGLRDFINGDLNEDNYQFYANKAKHVQLETQQAALNLIKEFVERTGIQNVCLVGGYALNVVANNFYLKHLPEVNFYFEPTADDTGISIGSAMMLHKRLTGEWPEPLANNFYQYYDYDEELNIGQKANLQKVVKLLTEGKSVAIFEGNPEAGPRALGHRSILFDPRNPDTKDIVNRIKKREWYRPFAGVILKEEFENYFDTVGVINSPYMTINFDAKEDTKELVPGIVHVDGTCRVQTVSEGTLYELLKLFYKKTKCPMILNTSFNLAGEALVQTKADAIRTFENSELDAVYFVDDGKLLLK
jgi:carbamoyltransferase